MRCGQAVATVPMTKKELVVMPKGYHHLAQDERCQIYALKKSGFSNSRIAIELDRSRSTIWREIKRNSGMRGYRHQQAQSRTYERRKSASSVPGKMTPDLCAVIDKEPGKGWSPEQISGRMRLDSCPVGRQSIYNYVHTDRKTGGNLWQCLRTLLSDLRSPSRVLNMALPSFNIVAARSQIGRLEAMLVGATFRVVLIFHNARLWWKRRSGLVTGRLT